MGCVRKLCTVYFGATAAIIKLNYAEINKLFDKYIINYVGLKDQCIDKQARSTNINMAENRCFLS